MAPGIPGIPNDVQGPAPDAPFRRSPRCSDTSDEPENLSYAKHSILSDKLLTAYTRHGVDAVVDRLSARGLDRRQPIGEHRGQDIDHLPIECAAAPGVAGGSVANPNQARSEILRLWTAEFAKGQDLDPGDKAYVAQVVAARTSLSQVDAEKRVNEIGKGLQLVIA